MERERRPAEEASILEQAAEWWVVLHGDSVSGADRREFAEWVARAPERVQAWLQMVRLMRALKSDDVQWPDTPVDVLIQEAKAAPAEILPLTRGRKSALVAAAPPRSAARKIALFCASPAVALLLVAGWLLLGQPQQYQTAVGEQRSILLADGSLVTLNTASKIEVSLSEGRRLIRLVRGEALFSVARDPNRPFDVDTGDTTLRAIGTRFNVDRRVERTIVTVMEGRVAVIPEGAAARRQHDTAVVDTPAGGQSTPEAPRQEPSTAVVPIVLSAAERVVITGSRLGPREHVANVVAVTSWTERRLVFERRPLVEVAAELNRYNLDAIVIENPELQRQEVTGVFQANDPASFVAFLSRIPGVQIRTTATGDVVVN